MTFPFPSMIAALALLAVSAPLPAAAPANNRVFELRTYTAVEGKLPDLVARFRQHTVRLFEKHGIQNIGYWIPQDRPNTLVYMVAHPSRERAKENWAAFRADPEWKKVAAESEAAGKIVANIESVYMDPADFSAIR